MPISELRIIYEVSVLYASISHILVILVDVIAVVACPRDQQTWVMETMAGLRSHYSTYCSGTHCLVQLD